MREGKGAPVLSERACCRRRRRANTRMGRCCMLHGHHLGGTQQVDFFCDYPLNEPLLYQQTGAVDRRRKESAATPRSHLGCSIDALVARLRAPGAPPQPPLELHSP